MTLKKLKFLISLILIVPVFNIVIFVGIAKGPNFDKEIIESPKKSKIITLSQPGNYKFIGVNTNKTYSPKSNIYAVDNNNRIVIKGKGTYNIVMENVYIDVNNIKDACPFTVEPNVDVHLTLIGKNTLKNENNDVGLKVEEKSALTISEKSGMNSLSAFGHECGICANKLIVEGGNITSCGDYGIYVENDMILESGHVIAKGRDMAVVCDNLEIKNGKIESIIYGEACESSEDKENIDSGNFLAPEDKIGIYSENKVKIESGQIQISGNEDGNVMLFGLGGTQVEIGGGTIMVSDADYGIIAGKVEMNDGNIITYGTKDAIRRGEDVEIDIKGGVINGQSYNQMHFDKELSDNDVSTEGVSDTIYSKMHMYIENNVLPIFVSLLLVFVLVIILNIKKQY